MDERRESDCYTPHLWPKPWPPGLRKEKCSNPPREWQMSQKEHKTFHEHGQQVFNEWITNPIMIVASHIPKSSIKQANWKMSWRWMAIFCAASLALLFWIKENCFLFHVIYGCLLPCNHTHLIFETCTQNKNSRANACMAMFNASPAQLSLFCVSSFVLRNLQRFEVNKEINSTWHTFALQ